MATDSRRTAARRAPTKATSEYTLMLELERLESLAEEMDELEVTSRTELQARIAALHARLDAQFDA